MNVQEFIKDCNHLQETIVYDLSAYLDFDKKNTDIVGRIELLKESVLRQKNITLQHEDELKRIKEIVGVWVKTDPKDLGKKHDDTEGNTDFGTGL